jgi:signal transduction histidine kinase
MSAQVQVVLIAAGCSGAVGTIGIGAIWLLRRASLRLSLMAASAIAVLAVVAGTLGTANAMFISQHDLRVVGMVCIVAGLVGLAISWLLGRQVEISSLALRQAARSMGQEGSGFRPAAEPMAAELAALSRELTATAGKLAESRERERRIEQSRRQLVAWVSHDLRTPLAGLQAMAEALQDGIATDPARYHRRIHAEATRLSAMVEDLFELSRIQSGTLSLAVDPVEAGDLVSDTVASMEPLAYARGVQLTGHAAGSLLIRADARELSRALANLVTNAIRHTPDNGRVLVTATAEAGGVLMTVSDSCGCCTRSRPPGPTPALRTRARGCAGSWPPHPATLRPGVAQLDAAAAVRPGLAGDALSRRTLRAAQRHRSHLRVPPGLLSRVPRQHPPGPARRQQADDTLRHAS